MKRTCTSHFVTKMAYLVLLLVLELGTSNILRKQCKKLILLRLMQTINFQIDYYFQSCDTIHSNFKSQKFTTRLSFTVNDTK